MYLNVIDKYGVSQQSKTYTVIAAAWSGIYYPRDTL